MDIRQKKEKLRKQLLALRNNISEEHFSRASEAIITTLKQQPDFAEAETIHCYVSMNVRGEVNTHELIKSMLVVGKKVVVPVTNFKDGTLRHIQLIQFSDLEKNKWGVLEPNGGHQVFPKELDLVVVPMVGGDEQCNRMGYGEGFYDRFLKGVEGTTIGLLFEQNVVDKIPVESFDIPLDKIITEQRIIERQ